jgi:hypothetical protein
LRVRDLFQRQGAGVLCGSAAVIHDQKNVN